MDEKFERSISECFTIRFYVKDVYGNSLKYPVDFADEILMLTGAVTLTDRAIAALTRMGFRFEEVLRTEGIK